MELIQKLADPNLIHTMPLGEKIMAGLMVVAVGMGITFLVLMFLWVMISFMSFVNSLFLRIKKDKNDVAKSLPQQTINPVAVESEESEEGEDEALIAVITAAIAASLETSIHNIVVSKIVRVQDETPTWAKSGRIEQISSRF